MFYDVKFGRKRDADVKDAAAPTVPNGNSSNGSLSNGHTKNTSELSIYEQFQNQVLPHLSVLSLT